LSASSSSSSDGSRFAHFLSSIWGMQNYTSRFKNNIFWTHLRKATGIIKKAMIQNEALSNVIIMKSTQAILCINRDKKSAGCIM
jgi:hypothetical protein